VRWSFSGKFLASGGDDKLVMIWKISKYASGEGIAFCEKRFLFEQRKMNKEYKVNTSDISKFVSCGI
jgi:WD40 repeat protein